MSNVVYSDSITLAQPIERGKGEKKQVIESVILRKPATGELRGLKLSDVLQMDINMMMTLIPRIAEPQLNEKDMETLDLVDMTNLCVEVLSFFDRQVGKGIPTA